MRSNSKGGYIYMKATYHGHSVVHIETNGYHIWIDPFLNGNKHTDIKPQDVKVDVILLTHGHGDHVGDTIEIAKNNDALVIAPFELATYLGWQGVKTHPLSIGGGREFEFGKVKLTQAFHGSGRSLMKNPKRLRIQGCHPVFYLLLKAKQFIMLETRLSSRI